MKSPSQSERVGTCSTSSTASHGRMIGREVTAVALGWHGTTAVTLTYRDPDSHVG